MERVADYIIKKINEYGIDHIFLISGRGILYLTDAVARNEKIQPVCTYHEQGASYAAMAYASARNGLAACLVSTGCAATNAITACLCAYQDNLPIVFISGNNPLSENTRHTGASIRTYGSQEADIIEIVESITKYAVMLDDKETVVEEIEKALHIAMEGRQGPVWIDIPLDVQNMRIEEEQQNHYPISCNRTIDANSINEQIYEVAECINSSNRPLLLIGGGARGAKPEISRVADMLGIPVVTTPSGTDIYGTGNKLSIGCLGSIGGSRAGNFAVQNSDLVVAIGTKLCTQTTGMKKAFARNASIIVIDVDDEEHKKDGIKIDTYIHADAKNFLSALCEIGVNRVQEKWIEKCIHWKEVFSIDKEEFFNELRQRNELDLYSISHIISDSLGNDATVITDAGFEELIVPSTICFRDNMRCLFPTSQGAMGYAIPAVIGAHLAGRQSIICIVGDGSVMMNIQELAIIKGLNIPVAVLVVNNGMYAVIRKRQKDLFRSRTIGNDPSDGVPSPNFELIAKSFEFDYLRIDSREGFCKQVDAITKCAHPMIVEVMSTHEQLYLHESYGRNERKRIVHRPIEDMAPFIDRQLLKEEMVVDLLEESI